MHDALRRAAEVITNEGTKWFVDANIKGFLGHVSHTQSPMRQTDSGTWMSPPGEYTRTVQHPSAFTTMRLIMPGHWLFALLTATTLLLPNIGTADQAVQIVELDTQSQDSQQTQQEKRAAERQAAREKKQAERAAARERKQAERQAALEKKQAERAAKQAELQAQREAEQAKREKERQAAEAELRKTCDRYKTWLADSSTIPMAVVFRRSPSSGEQKRWPALTVPRDAWIFQDSRTRELFGATFESVAAEERERWEATARKCRVEPGDQQREFLDPLATLGNVFSDTSRYDRIVEGLGRIRKAHARIEQLIEQLPELQGQADEDRFRQLAEEADGLESFADNKLHRRLQEAIAAAYRQTVDGPRTRVLLRTVRGANGYEGLVALAKIEDEISGDTIRYGAAPTWPDEVRERKEDLLRQVAEQEKADIDGLGHGLDGVKHGTEWYTEFSARKASVRNVVTAQWRSEIAQHFRKTRDQMLRESESEMAALIANAESQAQLGSVLSTFLPMEDDRTGDVGKEMILLAIARQAVIEKATALGISTRQAISDSNRTGQGPPTEGDTYDALMGKFAAINYGVKSVTNDCNRAVNRGGALDPFRAMACLVIGAGQGVTEGVKTIAAPQYRITTFRRVGKCAKAVNAQGWMCDYVLGWEGGTRMGLISDLLASGAQSQSRFVWDDGRWVCL